MKRAALKRKTPMVRGTKPLPRAAMRRRPPRKPPAADREYLAYVAAQPCCASSLGRCWGDVVAHHVRTGGQKVHRRTVPLCVWHHIHEFHQHGRLLALTRAATLVLFGHVMERLQGRWEAMAA